MLATANPDKAAEISAILSGVPRSGAPAQTVVGARCGGDRRHPGRQRQAQGPGPGRGDRAGRRCPTTPDWRSTPWAGLPGSTRPGIRGEHATYADNVAKLLAELARVGAEVPDRRQARFRTRGHGGLPRRHRRVGGRRGHRRDRRRSRGGLRVRLRPGLRTRRLRGSHLRPDERRGEASDLPPRPCLPGAGRPAGSGVRRSS